MSHEERIEYYYDKCHGDYVIVWDLWRTLSMHYGYWDETTKNHCEAARNMNIVLARRAGIHSTDRVLDAGCGVGGSSIFLAKHYKCSVVGLTLSQKQVERAKRNAAKRGVSDRTQFMKKNYQDTGFVAGSFDVVWGLDSICHSDDRESFLREVKRLLKPGGRLVVADCFQVNRKLTPKEESIMSDLAHGWAFVDFAVLDSFVGLLKKLGYRNIEVTDETERVRQSAKDMYRAYCVWLFPGWLAELVGIRKQVHAQNRLAAYLQYKAFQDNLVRYHIVRAVK